MGLELFILLAPCEVAPQRVTKFAEINLLIWSHSLIDLWGNPKSQNWPPTKKIQ